MVLKILGLQIYEKCFNYYTFFQVYNGKYLTLARNQRYSRLFNLKETFFQKIYLKCQGELLLIQTVGKGKNYAFQAGFSFFIAFLKYKIPYI